MAFLLSPVVKSTQVAMMGCPYWSNKQEMVEFLITQYEPDTHVNLSVLNCTVSSPSTHLHTHTTRHTKTAPYWGDHKLSTPSSCRSSSGWASLATGYRCVCFSVVQ